MGSCRCKCGQWVPEGSKRCPSCRRRVVTRLVRYTVNDGPRPGGSHNSGGDQHSGGYNGSNGYNHGGHYRRKKRPHRDSSYIPRNDYKPRWRPSGCFIFFLIIIAIVIFGIYYVSKHPLSIKMPQDTSPSGMARSTVQKYYDAINTHDYRTAYNLWRDNSNGSGQSYDQFVLGYGSTVHDDITFDSVVPQDENTVNVDITIHASEPKGTETFHAHYVVARVGDSWKFTDGSLEKIG